MAIKLDGSVEIKRISEFLNKVLSSENLANYKVLIDYENDDDSFSCSLTQLLSFAQVEEIYTPDTQPDISLGTPNTLDLNCNNEKQAIFEPQKEAGVTQAIDVDFTLSFSNDSNALLISMAVQLTGTRNITMPADVLVSNPSSIGDWSGAPVLQISAGTADIIEFQFLRYSTTSKWLLKVSEVAE